MKRFLILSAVFFAFVALVATAFDSNARPADINQFVGIAKYTNGNPAPYGTVVKAYLGGTLKGQTTIIRQDGRYQIQGDDDDFPTGSYTLTADDQVGMIGDEQNVSHTIHVTTERDVVLDTAY